MNQFVTRIRKEQVKEQRVFGRKWSDYLREDKLLHDLL